MYRRLLRILRPHAWRMAGTIACSIGAAALDTFSFALLIPFLNALFGETSLIPSGGGWIARVLAATIGHLLNPADPMGSLQRVIFVILASVLAKNLLVWVGGQLGAQLQEYVTRDLRDSVYAHLQRLPLGFFQRTKVGQIISRVLADTEQTKALITQLVTASIQNVATIVGYVIFLFGISTRLTLYALIVAPLLMGSLQPLLRKLRKGYRRLRNDYGEITSVLQEVIAGIRLVKSYGAERYEERRFTEASSRYSKAMVRVTRLAFMAQPITEVIGMAIAVVLLWIGARQVLVAHTLAGASLITFLAVVMRLLQPLKQVSQIPTAAQSALAAAERIFEVLDTPTEQATDRGTKVADAFRRDVVFENVSFAYGDEPVLRDISLVARRGEIVALVGASGAGKSTLVDLIPRFYEPTAGRILLDGTDTRDITLDSLRALTGIVSQDTVLFNDTVRANVAYGTAARYSQEQIEAAARAANAHAFIAELPEGYDTVLGERGTRLSGGQRQRIAIARALLTDPPILILDEATSALDTESERLVQEAIDRLLAGRTVFVIAHRLSTIVHATQILVLDRGRIVERGTHAELLAKGGAYHRLYEMQFRDREGSATPVEQTA
ncbi:MAG: ATP-binding cassette domain-containing protein [Gemmatimonadaceae bacterium]|nr:ATP-binding cassette domain-containing protein [Gemmatimonadaceae bacterium]NUQ93592.1 ATP-binding cassette domain-containing protein [Gemmatimonadaceae bacterium]NUR19083.1 ATP-binding cassette domain-containing protein [Gemmatimonadaceae bacterium]